MARMLLRLVVWLGIAANWTFAAFAFLSPAALLRALDLGDLDGRIWLFNYAVLLAILSCFYIPAAKDPQRYRTNAWLMIVARLVPAATFFAGVATGVMPAGFAKLGAGDATFGIAMWMLLASLRRAAI